MKFNNWERNGNFNGIFCLFQVPIVSDLFYMIILPLNVPRHQLKSKRGMNRTFDNGDQDVQQREDSKST